MRNARKKEYNWTMLRITITRDDVLLEKADDLLMQIAQCDVDDVGSLVRRRLHDQLSAVVSEGNDPLFYQRVVERAEAQAGAEAELFLEG